VISQFHSYLILVSRIASSSSMISPSLLIFGKIVWTRILPPITSFKKETWKTGCTREYGGNYNL
jgi:hypothetical protein